MSVYNVSAGNQRKPWNAQPKEQKGSNFEIRKGSKTRKPKVKLNDKIQPMGIIV